jgi:hypothetical protein
MSELQIFFPELQELLEKVHVKIGRSLPELLKKVFSTKYLDLDLGTVLPELYGYRFFSQRYVIDPPPSVGWSSTHRYHVERSRVNGTPARRMLAL